MNPNTITNLVLISLATFTGGLVMYAVGDLKKYQSVKKVSMWIMIISGFTIAGSIAYYFAKEKIDNFLTVWFAKLFAVGSTTINPILFPDLNQRRKRNLVVLSTNTKRPSLIHWILLILVVLAVCGLLSFALATPAHAANADSIFLQQNPPDDFAEVVEATIPLVSVAIIAAGIYLLLSNVTTRRKWVAISLIIAGLVLFFTRLVKIPVDLGDIRNSILAALLGVANLFIWWIFKFRPNWIRANNAEIDQNERRDPKLVLWLGLGLLLVSLILFLFGL